MWNIWNMVLTLLVIFCFGLVVMLVVFVGYCVRLLCSLVAAAFST